MHTESEYQELQERLTLEKKLEVDAVSAALQELMKAHDKTKGFLKRLSHGGDARCWCPPNQPSQKHWPLCLEIQEVIE